jgi:hypothetical protein
MSTLAISNLVVAHKHCAWCDKEQGIIYFDARPESNQKALKSFGRIIDHVMCPGCRDAILAHSTKSVHTNTSFPIPHVVTAGRLHASI